ncbi:MAG: ribonuclease Z [Desulfobacteraceae bacterium]|jgi:ribonuclease Z
MRPTFIPRLVNGPFEDPGLFVPLAFRKRAILFDLGDLSALSAGDILKTTHVFITHTHMDHFSGFDQMLRLLLGRQKSLHMFGPRGLLNNIAGKLQGYTWNLVRHYDEGLNITVTEIDAQTRTTRTFKCLERFAPSPATMGPSRLPLAYEEPGFNVQTAILDHEIPSLAFAVQERFHINILKPRLQELGLEAGPWVSRFKKLLYEGVNPDSKIEVQRANRAGTTTTLPIGELAENITRITAGQKIAYIADVVYSTENERKIIKLAHKADHLFIEAAFLEKDHSIAKKKYHLTAHQAGMLAHKSQVREMTIFHHSPRYMDQAHLFQKEARRSFKGPQSLQTG